MAAFFELLLPNLLIPTDDSKLAFIFRKVLYLTVSEPEFARGFKIKLLKGVLPVLLKRPALGLSYICICTNLFILLGVPFVCISADAA